ncbi:MAG: dockerin type I domain-containing protein, partial [Dehalococcoidia bacterium]
STWNGDGYFKVGYGECAIETYAYYVDVPASPGVTPSPTASATPTRTPSPTPTSTRPPTSTATHSASPTSTPTPSMGCKGPRPTGPNLPSQIASNPANNAQGTPCADSPPTTYHGCTDHTDTDGDGIPDCVKHLYGLCVYPGDPAVGYSSCANPSDSDGDSCPDWLEMMDVNGDRQVNTDDLLILAKRMGGVFPPNPIQDAVLDVNHDGAINTTDLLMLAKNTCAYRQAHGYTGSCKCSPE